MEAQNDTKDAKSSKSEATQRLPRNFMVVLKKHVIIRELTKELSAKWTCKYCGFTGSSSSTRIYRHLIGGFSSPPPCLDIPQEERDLLVRQDSIGISILVGRWVKRNIVEEKDIGIIQEKLINSGLPLKFLLKQECGILVKAIKEGFSSSLPSVSSSSLAPFLKSSSEKRPFLEEEEEEEEEGGLKYKKGEAGKRFLESLSKKRTQYHMSQG
jgi:hypothetical protein